MMLRVKLIPEQILGPQYLIIFRDAQPSDQKHAGAIWTSQLLPRPSLPFPHLPRPASYCCTRPTLCPGTLAPHSLQGNCECPHPDLGRGGPQRPVQGHRAGVPPWRQMPAPSTLSASIWLSWLYLLWFFASVSSLISVNKCCVSRTCFNTEDKVVN